MIVVDSSAWIEFLRAVALRPDMPILHADADFDALAVHIDLEVHAPPV